MPDHLVRIIVAYDEARVIGRDGRIPWDLPEDRRHFAEMTADASVIVGAATYIALGKECWGLEPLPGRRKFVLCSCINNPHWGRSVRDLDDAFRAAVPFGDPIWIIGGERVYRSALEAGVVAEVVASEVAGVHEGDRHFPTLGPGWREESREPRRGFSIVRYIREGVARA